MSKTVAVLGMGSVGKTSLIKQFVLNRMDDFYDPTIQDYYSTKIKFHETIYNINIIDTAGHIDYIKNDPKLFRNIDFYILVYDISNYKSFVDLIEYYNLILKDFNLNITICGNKSDLRRMVSYKEGFELACKLGCRFIETSAKNDVGLEQLWMNMFQKESKKKYKLCNIL
jgi:small GTP-binding protein